LKTPRLKRATLPDNRRVWCVDGNEVRGVPAEIPGYFRHGIAVAPGDVVLDVGANIGLFALDVAARGALVHAFEPMPATFSALEANARDFGGSGRIETHNLALGKAVGSANFAYFPLLSAISTQKTHSIHHHAREVVGRVFGDAHLTPRAAWFRRSHPRLRWLWIEMCVRLIFRSKPVTCEVETVSRMLEKLPIERVSLLKIDVEGAEWDVLQGISDADWPRIEQIAAEVHDENGRLKQFCELLEARGFEVHHEPDPVAAQWEAHMVWARRVGETDR
jgi:FkbM family methyltransferase